MLRSFIVVIVATFLTLAPAVQAGMVIDPYAFGGGAAPPPVSLQYVASSSIYDDSNGTNYSFASVPVGAEAGDRRLIVHVVGPGNTAGVPTAVTVDGNAAALVTDGTTTAAARISGAVSDFWIIEDTTGTTATIAVTWSQTQNRMAIAVYRMTGGSGTQAAQVVVQTSSSATSLAGSLTIPSDGAGLGGAFGNSAEAFSWTNLTLDYDVGSSEVGGQNSFTGGSSTTAGAATRTATITAGGASPMALSLVAW